MLMPLTNLLVKGTIQTVEEITHHLSLAHDYYMNYGLGFFCILDKITHEFIGQAGLFHVGFETSQTDIELAYRLHTAYWGKGYALEAAAASLDYTFDELGWDSVTHLIADENIMSQKLAARLGSEPGEHVNLPGSLSGERLCVWRQTQEDWIRLKKRFMSRLS